MYIIIWTNAKTRQHEDELFLAFVRSEHPTLCVEFFKSIQVIVSVCQIYLDALNSEICTEYCRLHVRNFEYVRVKLHVCCNLCVIQQQHDALKKTSTSCYKTKSKVERSFVAEIHTRKLSWMLNKKEIISFLDVFTGRLRTVILHFALDKILCTSSRIRILW